MQIVRLERSSFDLFCPVTGRPVFDENQQPNTPTLRGSWAEWALDEPLWICDELNEQWQSYLSNQPPSCGDPDIVAFLHAIDRPGWVAFEIIVYNEPMREMWLSNWTVLDLREEPVNLGFS